MSSISSTDTRLFVSYHYKSRLDKLDLSQLITALFLHIGYQLLNPCASYFITFPCKLDERLIVSEKLADHMKNHEINDFWKDIRKHSKSKSALFNCIDGVTGENAIADLWRDHYESLLNDSTHHDEKADVLQSFNNMCSHAGMYVTMSEVLEVVKDLPNRKSSGLDGLNGESLKFSDPLMCLLLSICYTCMFKHSY